MDNLPRNHAVNDGITAESGPDYSGVEVITPKKSLTLNPDEPVTTVPGIGVIQTCWVGCRGREEISKKIEESKTQTLVKSLRSELALLSKECLKAFEVTGLSSSTNTQVKTAIGLCHKHTASIGQQSIKNDRLHTLWSREEHHHINEDITTAATSILGKELVDTLTEVHKEPPDVSFK